MVLVNHHHAPTVYLVLTVDWNVLSSQLRLICLPGSCHSAVCINCSFVHFFFLPPPCCLVWYNTPSPGGFGTADTGVLPWESVCDQSCRVKPSFSIYVTVSFFCPFCRTKLSLVITFRETQDRRVQTGLRPQPVGSKEVSRGEVVYHLSISQHYNETNEFTLLVRCYWGLEGLHHANLFKSISKPRSSSATMWSQFLCFEQDG